MGVVSLAERGSVFPIIGIASYANRSRASRPNQFNTLLLAELVVLCQAVVGGIGGYKSMQLFSTLLHAGLMAVLTLVLREGCRLTIPFRATVAHPNRAVAP
jgi:hypothetical protein